MSTLVIGIMAFFMSVGAVDKALFDSRFGYGREFERGLNTMGPLAMIMVGIMCAAPALGTLLGPFFGRLFTSVGSDPAMFAGMVLGVDMGGLPLAESMARSEEAAVLSGIGLGGTLGCILTYAMPLSLSMCSTASRLDVSKGLVIGIVAAPLSLLGVGLTEGYALSSVLRLGIPAFIFAAAVAGALAFFAEKTARACLLVSRFLAGAFILLLASAALEHYFGFALVPGMAPIGRQFELIGCRELK